MKNLTARNTGIMMVKVDVSTFRFPQPTDHFKVKLTTDVRQYVVINTGHKNATTSVVTFAVSATGTKLTSCTCMDFQNIKKHGRQCKHIHVAYTFHVARMKAKQTVEHVQAEKPAPAYCTAVVKRNGCEFVGKIRIS